MEDTISLKDRVNLISDPISDLNFPFLVLNFPHPAQPSLVLGSSRDQSRRQLQTSPELHRDPTAEYRAVRMRFAPHLAAQ